MKRILVISDNPSLADELAKVIDEQSILETSKFVYRYSSINKSPEKMIGLGYLPIDIKDPINISWALTNFDLVLSLHCKQVFPKEIVSKICSINIHPGLNSHNRGWYPQVFSIINKMPAGATIHVMTEDIDAGPVIAQKQVEIQPHDTSLSLYEKIQDAEVSLLKEYLRKIVSFDWQASDVISSGNYNSVQDFKSLCCLDLDSVASLGEHIDLLRALTHPPFKNAYFIDPFGHKVYVNIQLQVSE